MRKKIIALSILLALVLCSASCGKSSQQATATVQTSTALQSQTTQPIGSDATDDLTSNSTSATVNNSSTTKAVMSRNTLVNTSKNVATTTAVKKTSPTKKKFQPITTAPDGSVIINGTKYIQTFFDDFNGTDFDRKKWAVCPEYARNSRNVWRRDMVKLDGKGNLIVGCDKYQGDVYKSGGVRTRDLFYQAYGYFEIRCMLQKSPGFWGAFWLMPDTIDYGVKGGSDGTEIDIFESAYLSTDRINHALHWDGYDVNHETISVKSTVPGVYEGFHTFALEWTKDAYRFFIDGEKTYEITSDKVDICQKELYMKITTEVGTWAGTIDDSKLPDGITVDYVRVFQQK